MKTADLTEFERTWICKAAQSAIRSLTAIDKQRALEHKEPQWKARIARLRELIDKVR